MFPVLFGEGDWAVSSYAFFGMLAFLGGVYAFRNLGEREGLDRKRLVDFGILLGIMGWVGARIAHVLFDGMLMDYINLCVDPEALGRMLPGDVPCTTDAQCLTAQNSGHDIGNLCDTASGHCVPEQDCFRPFNFFAGGYTFYGGFILSTLTCIWLSRRWKWNILQMADIGALASVISLAIGRVGCFLSGCCFGGTCSLPWGVRFPQGSDAFRLHYDEHRDMVREHFKETGIWESLPVHPTQLYEVFALFAIFAILYLVVRTRRVFYGQVTAWLFILYGIARFTIEFFRADQRGGALFFSTSQWIALPLFAMGIGFLLWGKRSAPPIDKEPTEPPSTDTTVDEADEPTEKPEDSEA